MMGDYPYCPVCNMDVHRYHVIIRPVQRVINGIRIEYMALCPYCRECHKPIDVPYIKAENKRREDLAYEQAKPKRW